MTPEERLHSIEEVLKSTAQHQARQQEQLGRLEHQINEHNEAIRGLIVVGRTCLDSIKELREDHKRVSADIDKMREAQSVTEEKLNILIETVDRIIRRENHP